MPITGVPKNTFKELWEISREQLEMLNLVYKLKQRQEAATYFDNAGTEKSTFGKNAGLACKVVELPTELTDKALDIPKELAWGLYNVIQLFASRL